MSVKLTEKQTTVLTILNAQLRRIESDGPLSSPEIGELVFQHMRVRHGAREWASVPLKQLLGRGLVERLGTSSTNARCWTITDAGLAVIRELKAKDGEDGK